jgi:PleD family two-component response regulator
VSGNASFQHGGRHRPLDQEDESEMEHYVATRPLWPKISHQLATEPTVWCVDDHEVIFQLLGEVLSPSGFRVVCESDSQRARRKIDFTDIDAVTVDYEMPGCNGLELASAIRAGRPNLPS